MQSEEKQSNRRQKDHFSLALQKPPLLSLSSFSCGASVLLELTQIDFSNRYAMMDSYSELRHMYQNGTTTSSNSKSKNHSPTRAKKEHLRLRSTMFNGNGRSEALRTAANSFNASLAALGTVGMFLLAYGKKYNK